MFALVFAVVSLSNIDPDPIVTPAPGLHERLSGAGAGAFAPGSLLSDSGLSADVNVAPVCSFGSPQLGSDLWTSANALTRALAMPPCAADGFTGFSSAQFLPFGFVSPWLASPAGGLVRLEPVGHGATGSGSAGFHATGLPVRIVAEPAPVLRASAPQPAVVRARSIPVALPERRH